MFEIVVIDETAESRAAMVEQIHRLLEAPEIDPVFVPRFQVRPLAREEVPYHGVPDLCIVGSCIVKSDVPAVAGLRKLLPETPFIVCMSPEIETLPLIERLAAMGVDDTIDLHGNAKAFFRKLLFLSRKAVKKERGDIIVVDSAKGGLGVTSLVSAIGGHAADSGLHVLLVDGDLETQDLSRFLQARPFVNENLQLLIDQHRPVTSDFTGECIVAIAEERVACLPPPADGGGLAFASPRAAKLYVSVLENAASFHDLVIVDGSPLPGNVLSAIYRSAAHAIFVVDQDPASLFASVDRLRRFRTLLPSGSRLTLVETRHRRAGLSPRALRGELARAAGLVEEDWLPKSVPFCPGVAMWPGSGLTAMQYAGRRHRTAMKFLGTRLGISEIDLMRSSTAFLSVDRLRRGLHSAASWIGGSLKCRSEKDSHSPGPLQAKFKARGAALEGEKKLTIGFETGALISNVQIG